MYIGGAAGWIWNDKVFNACKVWSVFLWRKCWSLWLGEVGGLAMDKACSLFHRTSYRLKFEDYSTEHIGLGLMFWKAPVVGSIEQMWFFFCLFEKVEAHAKLECRMLGRHWFKVEIDLVTDWIPFDSKLMSLVAFYFCLEKNQTGKKMA